MLSEQATVQRHQMLKWVLDHPGKIVTSTVLVSEIGANPDAAAKWLHARWRTNRTRDPIQSQLDGKFHQIGYGQYVYFPGAVPIDFRDRIRDYAETLRRRRNGSTPSAAPKTPPPASKGLIMEVVRKDDATNRMVLVDENGDLWVGKLTRVDV